MSTELYPGKHLFVDDFLIQEMHAARRVLHQPEKHHDNPVLRPERPWEEAALHAGAFLYDEERGCFRLWYTSEGPTVIGTRVLVRDNPPKEVRESHICYAQSADGVHWDRPDLGLAARERYPGNNILIPSKRPPGRTALCHLVDDPADPDPEQRFRMIYLDQAEEGDPGGGLAPDQKLRLHAHSPDGIQWTVRPWQPEHLARLFGVLAYLEEKPKGELRPEARYILYGQRGSPWKTRQIGRRDSDDFVHWSGNRPVLESCLGDTPGLEFYYLQGAVRNQTCAGLHLGMLGAYHADLRRKYDPARNDGVTDCQLAWSRDSVRWERWPEPFIPRGEPGSFDYGGVYCEYPAIRGDRIYFMYTGNSTWHGQRGESTLGLATLRLDGFVSVQSESFTEGVVVTRPHHWNACELRVNVESLSGGLGVQLQDETGRAFDGFSTSEVEALRTDGVDTPVSWKEKGRDLRELKGRMVALRFTLRPEDRLYSYTLVRST